jgi:very-short-patch-repair endonuclease
VYPTSNGSLRKIGVKKKISHCLIIVIPNIKIIIELDGRQHFKQVMKWDSPENQFKTISIKKNVRTIMDIQSRQIIQEDVLTISMIGSKI